MTDYPEHIRKMVEDELKKDGSGWETFCRLITEREAVAVATARLEGVIESLDTPSKWPADAKFQYGDEVMTLADSKTTVVGTYMLDGDRRYAVLYENGVAISARSETELTPYIAPIDPDIAIAIAWAREGGFDPSDDGWGQIVEWRLEHIKTIDRLRAEAKERGE